MKISLISKIIFICVCGIFISLTWPAYQSAMHEAQRRLTGSEIFTGDKGTIEYSVQGDGIPVLLLHGAGGGYDQGLWLGKMSLGAGYKFIAVSRFGYLRSPIPRPSSIKTQAALYAALLDYLHIQQVIVVGGSAGGPSAIEFANDYPERISALILLSAVSRSHAAGDKTPFYIHIIHLIQKSDYVYWLASKFLQPLILNLLGMPSAVYQSLSPEQQDLAQEMLDTMHPMSQRARGTLQDGKMLEHYDVPTNHLAAPTLIMHAKDDALVSYAHAGNAHKKIPQSQLISFDTGGHVMLPQMAKVRKSIKEFISGSAGVPPANNDIL